MRNEPTGHELIKFAICTKPVYSYQSYAVFIQNDVAVICYGYDEYTPLKVITPAGDINNLNFQIACFFAGRSEETTGTREWVWSHDQEVKRLVSDLKIDVKEWESTRKVYNVHVGSYISQFARSGGPGNNYIYLHGFNSVCHILKGLTPAEAAELEAHTH